MTKIIVSEKANIRINNKCCAENAKKAITDGYAKAICDECGIEYLKYYSAKKKICCSCREKKRLLNHGSAVEQRDGFPKNPGYFKTYDEIQKYFDHDEILCLICGNGFVSLPAHLSAIQDISADAYKEMFGLPLSRGLITNEFHEHRSDDCKKRKIGKDKEFMLKMQDVERLTQRAMNPCLRQYTNLQLAKAVKGNKNHVVNKKNIVKAFCSNCAGMIEREITEHALLVQGCKILCNKCKRKGYLESQKRYREKKKHNA